MHRNSCLLTQVLSNLLLPPDLNNAHVEVFVCPPFYLCVCHFIQIHCWVYTMYSACLSSDLLSYASLFDCGIMLIFIVTSLSWIHLFGWPACSLWQFSIQPSMKLQIPDTGTPCRKTAAYCCIPWNANGGSQSSGGSQFLNDTT